MFEDLTEKQILKSIDSLIVEGNLRETSYAVWYHDKLISPARVISHAYELVKKPISRITFDTDQAQSRLLDLGFPIVDNSRKDRFFTSKDLWSFKKIVERKKYDFTSQVDKNIGLYLNKVSWEKTRLWNEKLKQLGWVIKGYKHWNKQNGSAGQGLKDYTWYRVYPKKRMNDLVCFTIGIHADESLVYKLDCTWSDPFFTQERKNYFRERANQLNSKWQFVYSNELNKYTWDSLAKKTDKYFSSQLENFYTISREFFPDKRLFRLTWNENNWELPSGHHWNKKNWDKANVAYENQHGYGHEEWLFNGRYRVGEFQYGYIRGIEKMSTKAEYVDKAILFTIDSESKQRYLVAEISNIEIIEGYEIELKKVEKYFAKYDWDLINELKEVEADHAQIKREPLRPNVKFNWQDAKIYNAPIPVSFLSDATYNRFQPYKIEGQLEKLLNSESERESTLEFNSGKASTTSSYTKTVLGGKKSVTRSHSNITNDLFDYLHKVDCYSKEKLSAEKTRVGGAIVDFVVKEKNGFKLFEAKTSSTGQQNIRQAIGQLLEYALMDKKVKILELIIVGPALLKEYEKGYFERLQEVLNLKLYYWAYQPNESKLINKFIKQ